MRSAAASGVGDHVQIAKGDVVPESNRLLLVHDLVHANAGWEAGLDVDELHDRAI